MTAQPKTAQPRLTQDLLERHDVAAPRYTSYPAIPFWGETTPEAVSEWLGEAPAEGERSLSLYTHIPFCTHRCYYCACLVVITPQKEQSVRYLEALKTEIRLVADKLKAPGPVTQFHLGGGTPTFLSPEQMRDWVETTRSLFSFDDQAEISLEVDPRTVNGDYLAALKDMGFNRISLGVQDFDEGVMEAVGRVQPYEMVAKVVEQARKLAFDSVNFDLIYGLPKQTAKTFETTLERVKTLMPDRLAIYNYAHLPDTHPHQDKMDPATMPDTQEKTRIFLLARETLMDVGYHPIGLDHFSLPEDDLTQAYGAGTMRRNFMGYSTQAGTDMLAFGLTAISEFGRGFWQNEKKLINYYRQLEAGLLPVVRGLPLSTDDLLRKGLISRLFCQGKINFAEIEARYGVSVPQQMEAELKALQTLAADGLVELSPEEIQVTGLGQLFLRNIAMVFDAYLKKGTSPVKFSRAM